MQAVALRIEAPVPGARLAVVAAPRLVAEAQAGQFVLLRHGPTWDPYLRDPLFIHRLDHARGDLWMLAWEGQPGYAPLAHCAPDAVLDLIGPCGNGYAPPPTATRIGLLCPARHVAPLVAVAGDLCARGLTITLVCHAPTADQVYPAHLLPHEVEYRVVTDDGSAGEPGPAGRVLAEAIAWADAVLCAGPLPWLLQLRAAHERLRQRDFAQVLMLPEMTPCGVGACGLCAVRTRKGVRLACVDGPAFPLGVLEE